MSTEAPLRILLVVHGFPPEFRGGTELYTFHLAKALRGRGHDVHVLCGSDEGREPPWVERLLVDGVPVHRVYRQGLFVDNWDKSYAPDVEVLLGQVLADVRPDIVHVQHWIRLTRTLVTACHEAGLPTVVTTHDTWTSCPRCFRIRDGAFCERELSVTSCLDCVPRDSWHVEDELATEIELFRDDFRQELALARRVIAPSAAHRDLVARTCGMDPDRITVIAHGTIADFEPLRCAADADGRLRIGHWGKLFPMKGFHLILEAARTLPEELRDRLSIACWGEAPDPEYERRLAELSKGLDVTFNGSFDRAVLQSAELDCAAFPSFASESYSFVLDEAFALGLPVITSDRGAFHERVGAAGLMCEAEDASSLATALRRFLEEPELLESCRAQIPTPVAMDDHAAELESLYASVLEEPAPDVQPDRDLGDRHRIHRSFRMEERIRQLMDALGRVGQESDRAAGLQVEFDKVRGVVEARDAHIGELTQSISSFEAELKQQRNEIEKRGSAYERTRAEYVQLEERFAELLGAMEDYRAVVTRMDRDLEDVRRRAESARRRENELGERVTALEQELVAAKSHRDELVAERDAVTELARDRQTEIDGVRGEMHRIQDELGRERQHAAALANDNAKLGGRAVQLQASLEEREAVGRGVLENLVRLAHELGVDPGEIDGNTLDRLSTLVDAVHPAVMGNRALLGKMSRSVDKVASEAQIIEEERQQLESALTEEVEARKRRRRHAWYRLAERLAGGGPELRSRGRNGHGGGLRVLLVIHDFLPRHAAGSEIYTHKLAKGLRARGVNAHVLYTEARPGVHSYFLTDGEYDGVPCTEISHQHTTAHFDRTYSDPQMERIFDRVLDEFRPDVVHVQHLHYHSIGYISVAKARGIPVVYTLHEYMLLCPRGGQMLREDLEICERPIPEKCADCIKHLALEPAPEDEGRARLSSRLARHLPTGVKTGLKRLTGVHSGQAGSAAPTSSHADYARAIQERLDLIKRELEGVDLFLSPSEFLRQKFIDCGMVDPDRIIASDNGQDASPFEGIVRSPSPNLRVGYIGTIADYKGVHVIVDAMNLLADLDDVQCDIWGSLHSFPEYAQALPSRIVNERTRLRGRYDPKDIGHVLSELDALIVPSLWYENSPLTIHEAFMAGIPIIASRLGGMAEYVHHGKNGLLFEVGDAEELASRIREIHADRGMLERLRNEHVEVKPIGDDVQDMLGRYGDLVNAARTEGAADA